MPGLRAEFRRAAERSLGLASPAGHLRLRWEDSLSSRPSVSAAISVAIGACSVDRTEDAVAPCEVDQSILNALAESTTRQRCGIGARGLPSVRPSAHQVQSPAPARLVK